jgi:hypothetical protein
VTSVAIRAGNATVKIIDSTDYIRYNLILTYRVIMNTELYNKVFPVAQKVRQWTQKQADRKHYYAHSLMGWCAIASAQLFRELKRAGIDSTIHLHEGDGPCHCFVVVDDHVVDVTATQFDEFVDKEIVILPKSKAEKYDFYTTCETFNYPNDLRDYQLDTDWPRDQIVRTR